MHTARWLSVCWILSEINGTFPLQKMKKLIENYGTATNLLRLNLPSVPELQCPVTRQGQQPLMSVPTCSEAAWQLHTHKPVMPLQRLYGIHHPHQLGGWSTFLFRNKAGQLFRKKCQISELQLNINKTSRVLELSRKCSLKAFIMIIIITSVTEETHCAALHSINVL